MKIRLVNLKLYQHQSCCYYCYFCLIYSGYGRRLKNVTEDLSKKTKDRDAKSKEIRLAKAKEDAEQK